jgi:hypothetical protein
MTINTPIRYCLWSPDLGVYLGNGDWSRRDAQANSHAPTFLSDELSKAHEDARTATEAKAGPRPVTVLSREVWPDTPGPGGNLTFASSTACKNACLEGWGET